MKEVKHYGKSSALQANEVGLNRCVTLGNLLTCRMPTSHHV